MSESSLLWNPLLESAAQTIVGAIASYSFTEAISKYYSQNSFAGPMDLWKRGILENTIEDNDNVRLDCLISPYTQLFPGNPYNNARKWKEINNFNGTINSQEYKALEFFCSSDPALRIGSLNGETLVGLFQRFGYVGDGIIGVAPTSLIKKKISQFFHPSFYGARARVSGKISRCPSQHGFIAQGISSRAGVPFNFESYKNLWFLKINSISLYTAKGQRSTSLLGSCWTVGTKKDREYNLEYGYISNETERMECLSNLKNAKYWNKTKVYFDDLEVPDASLSFKKNYIV